MEAGESTRFRCHSNQETVSNGNSLPRRADPRSGDLVLVRRLLARDEAAWREFVSQYRNLILHRIHAVAREVNVTIDLAEVVEEICADVFALLLSRNMDSLRQFSGRSRLSTWLAVVVRRTALRYFSRNGRRPGQPDTAEFDQIPLPEFPSTVALHERREQLHAALTQLSDNDQRILALYYEQQHSYAQIGEAFGISENSVGPRLNRARQRLRRILDAKCDEPCP
jgi:RNA polymerase sigma-70 factor, ECF subfamily